MNDKEALEKWKDYDQTFTDPMDDMEIKNSDNYREAREEIAHDPIPKLEGWGRTAEFTIVGNGERTDQLCGAFWGYKGCLNVDLHGHVTLDGANHKGNVFWKKRYHSCDRPECPICYATGWAVREAQAIEKRLLKASRGWVEKAHKNKKGRCFPEIRHAPLGEINHIIESVPVTDYGLPFVKLKKKAQKILGTRGVIGGVSIFHAFRYRSWFEAQRDHQLQGWYFAPHFHVLGFLDSGYGRCRSCANVWLDEKGMVHVKDTAKCLACSGFEGRTRRAFSKECETYGRKYGFTFDDFGDKKPAGGWIVKVGGKRKTVKGTAWYQLNHSTMVRGSERAHVATWFGVCSYVRLKLDKEDKKLDPDLCPICGHELEPIKFVGDAETDPKNAWWLKEGEDPYLDKDGDVRWIPEPRANRF